MNRDGQVKRVGGVFAALVMGVLLNAAAILFTSPKGALALSSFIDPDGDGGSTGFTLTGGASHFETLDDGTRQPTTPNTSDHISAGANSGAFAFLRMSTLSSVQSVSQITVWAYHNDGSNAEFRAQLYDDNESTTISSESAFAQLASNGWNSVTFSALSLNQSQLDTLSIRISVHRNGGGQPANGIMYAMYAEVTYSAGPIISLTTDGVVDFGAIPPGGTRDTTAGGTNDAQTIRIDGDPVNLDARSTGFSDGGNTWNLGGSAGSDQVHFEFSPDGSGWTTFAAADTLYTFDTNVPNGATRNLYLRLTAPTGSGSFAEHSATITIVASVP